MTGDIERFIGAKVRQLREERSCSQADLARKLAEVGWAMHQTTISKVEAGSRPIRVADVYAFAEVLGVPAASFFFAIQPDGEEPAADELRDRLMAADQAAQEAEQVLLKASSDYAEALAERDRLARAANHSSGDDQ